MGIRGTDFNEIRKFAKQLEEFTEEIDYEMKRIVKETEGVTAYSWKGRQADEFKDVICESKEEMDKQIEYLKSLITEIEKKADHLQTVQEISSRNNGF